LQVWRRHSCPSCKAIFTSHEKADFNSTLRVRKNELLEPFNGEILLIDVFQCLSHRKTAQSDARELTDTIVAKLLPCKDGIISVQKIIHTAQKVIERFDKAAGVYYQAHYAQRVR
jgi:transcriptional regulator NrdR family protein